MSSFPIRSLCTGAFALAIAGAASAAPADEVKPKAIVGAPDKGGDAGLAKFCANAAPAVQEARIAWQMKRLGELDGQIKQRIADLEKSEAAAREWVDKRDALLKAASDDVVAIYTKMQPEAAATQMNAMADSLAAAILSKLKPKTASAILNEMEAARAGKLAAIIAGAAAEDKKS